MRLALFAAAAVFAAGQAVADEQFLLVANATADCVMKFDAKTGELLDPDFLPDANGSPYDFTTPKGVLQVGNEIWVADQTQDYVMRFDLEGNFISRFGGSGFDNIRGMEYAEGTVYLTNGAQLNGAPGKAVIRLTTEGEVLGYTTTQEFGDPMDVQFFNGELLVANDATDRIDRYSLSGSFLGVFHDSNGLSGIDLPQQMTVSSAGTLLVAGFDPPIGIYEYDATGAQVNFWQVGNGNRGVHEMADGRLFFTDGNGVHIYDRATGAMTNVVTGFNAQYVALITVPTKNDCLANCDGSTDAEGNPTLSVADFTCFRNAYLAGDLEVADCTGDGALSVADFTCFRNAYLAGCP